MLYGRRVSLYMEEGTVQAEAGPKTVSCQEVGSEGVQEWQVAGAANRRVGPPLSFRGRQAGTSLPDFSSLSSSFFDSFPPSFLLSLLLLLRPTASSMREEVREGRRARTRRQAVSAKYARSSNRNAVRVVSSAAAAEVQAGGMAFRTRYVRTTAVMRRRHARQAKCMPVRTCRLPGSIRGAGKRQCPSPSSSFSPS